jgi:hypothetical protein
VSKDDTIELPERLDTNVLKWQGILPDTRTVRMPPPIPLSERMAMLACFTIGSSLMALLEALMV